MNLRQQKGFTLVEMLVALMISAIFFSIFVGVVLATFETLRSGDERTVAQQNARIGLNYIANDIRQATEITPLRIDAYRDWATGGFPIADDTIDPAFPGALNAWPIYRLSVDSDIDGYIDLDIDGGSGDQNEYADFRDERYQTLTGTTNSDPNPYDVRPLAPNRLSLLFYGSTYYPNTQYYRGTGLPNSIDLDGNDQPNPTSAVTRVTYEHQLVPPLHPESYKPNFSGLDKEFNMVVNRVDGNAVNDTDGFVIMRSFETYNPTEEIQMYGDTSQPSDPGGLGAVSQQLQIDNEYLRQPVADHVINLRFRYWHISGQEMMEIRYDPDETTIGGGGIRSDDGYYRYFDINGDEIYVWYNKIPGINQKVPLLATDYDQTDLDNVPDHSFIIYGGDSGTDEYDRGTLLFEGWKFVNAISITVRTANNQTLEIYRSTINHNIDADPLNPDYGMGFIDFGMGDKFTDADDTLNMYDPLYQAADNVRISTAPVGTVTDLFDFVEPNMNPNYNPSAFTTLQTMVYLPSIAEKADAAMRSLFFGFRHN
jgi:prepilin-type N-terminal cleavage/methylation domain-containing protein